MPENPFPWLIETLMDMGPTEPAAHGMAPIGWRTLDAWCNRTRIDLPIWQCRLLRRLSGDYLAESDRAREMDCPSPWAVRNVEVNRAAVSAQIGSVMDRIMASMAKGKKKG